ncbi:MAG TPA: hypothetical protein VFA58_01325, partial [Chthoniobacterales bacterium]|nr:hypothetical protein [Chthoniobacterales bacterium]
PGTFSFISGPVFYMSMATAFLIYGALNKGAYKNWLLLVSGIALGAGVFVSGSKSAVASVLLVVGAVGIILILRPRAVNRFGWVLVIVVIVAVLVSRLSLFKEGATILSDRFTSAAEAADTTVVRGTFDRIVNGFTEGLTHLDKVPFWGFGLGIGTNVGGRILIGRPAFLLNENEWSRVIGESGPLLGLAFLLWRTLLTLRLAKLSFRSLWHGNLLPILLFSSGSVILLNGQLGQPTTLGFAALLSGLCLASSQLDPAGSSAPPAPGQVSAPARPRRSAYAERLHSSPLGIEQNNGLADR